MTNCASDSKMQVAGVLGCLLSRSLRTDGGGLGTPLVKGEPACLASLALETARVFPLFVSRRRINWTDGLELRFSGRLIGSWTNQVGGAAWGWPLAWELRPAKAD
jgi:hypothetical protein